LCLCGSFFSFVKGEVEVFAFCGDGSVGWLLGNWFFYMLLGVGQFLFWGGVSICLEGVALFFDEGVC